MVPAALPYHFDYYSMRYSRSHRLPECVNRLSLLDSPVECTTVAAIERALAAEAQAEAKDLFVVEGSLRHGKRKVERNWRGPIAGTVTRKPRPGLRGNFRFEHRARQYQNRRTRHHAACRPP